MGNLERNELYLELSEVLDNLIEILEDYEVDQDEDDEFAELFDSIERIKAIVNKE